MFIEQIKLNFTMCAGDEKPDERAQIYVENEGMPEERRFRWIETEKPADVEQFIEAGRAKFIRHKEYEIIEVNGRYFRQAAVGTGNSVLP